VKLPWRYVSEVKQGTSSTTSFGALKINTEDNQVFIFNIYSEGYFEKAWTQIYHAWKSASVYPSPPVLSLPIESEGELLPSED